MRTMKLRTLAAAMVIAFAPAAYAATATPVDDPVQQLNTTAENKGQTQVATKIASSFGKLAGSDANTLKLVQALRNGTAVTLTTTTSTGTGTGTGTGAGTGTTSTTTITPPTGKMGWGNVFISLALAKDTLARAGITNPTTAQLQAALNGGEVTGADGKTVTLKGILQMRADGMGWGQIAQASGTKVGPVVSSIKSAHNKVAALPAASTTTTASAAATSAGGKSASKGVVTAGGAASATTTAAGSGHGNSANAPGRGVVTAAGGSATNVATANAGKGQGAGVVNASGGNSAGVSNAGGNGKGNAGGNGNGKGKGGG